MPSITAPSKVLVTGANGFIATHIVKVLLETGYFVRGTVRDDTKGDYLKKLFNDDKFEYVVMNDIAKPGAFDDAIKDVDAALHTAASLKPELGDPANLINDVVLSTTGILESAKQVGSNVQRVIFTGTTASVYQPPQGKYIFTEKDWNEAAPKAVEQQGAAASPLVKYAAAKVSAERAAWEWIKTNKNSVKFDIVTICPPLVYGPMIHKLEGQQDVNMSNRYFLMNLKAPRTEEQIAKKEGSYIDVRDLAKIHVDLLSKEKAANERFIASA
ncbi:methylglyoxal reductase (NADPH-dependent) gre2, partial [Tulasnella sp. 418]